jgi:hypothetical protein
MLIHRKIALAGALATAGSFGVAATTAGAQGPIVTGGLVNVVVTEVQVIDDVEVDVVVRDVNVGVAAGLALAANVCDVNVNVLAEQFRTGQATCENVVDGGTATISQV